MLVATCKDANNTLLHVATVVCDKENADNYTWLYKMMKKNADMDGVLKSPKTTIYTDQHTSHAPAINLEAGNCQWRFCLRHVLGNIKQNVGSNVNGWIYHASRAPTKVKFSEIMEQQVKPTKPLVYEALMGLDPKRWTHHAGRQDTVIADQTTSNPVEKNMSMIGNEARKLPPFGLAMSILDNSALKMAQKADLRGDTEERLTPYSAKVLEAQRPSRHCHWERLFHRPPSRQQLRQPSAPTFRRRVGDDYRQLHMHLRSSVGLVDSGYRLDTYRALYADERCQVLLPVPDELAVDTTMLPPRQVKGRAGRPKGAAQTKRFKSRGENSASFSFNVRLTP
ncbi:unnamed protein product, partial [Laminaria digitata]